MVIHFSRFGYTTACGKHVSRVQSLTVNPKKVTCKSCANTKLVVLVKRSGQWR